MRAERGEKELICSRQHFFPINKGKGNSYEHGIRTTSLFGRGSGTRGARGVYQTHLYAPGDGYFGLHWAGSDLFSIRPRGRGWGQDIRWWAHGVAGGASRIYGR